MAAHTLVGVGWFGITLAKLVLEIVAATTGDLGVARAGYVFAGAFDRLVFPPAALATLITGIVLSVGTAWGLVRHWWIVVKLALTLGVIVTGVVFVGAWTEQALVAPDAELGAISLRLIGWASVHALMLAAATVISVRKPWGRSGRAARKLSVVLRRPRQSDRRAATRNRARRAHSRSAEIAPATSGNRKGGHHGYSRSSRSPSTRSDRSGRRPS